MKPIDIFSLLYKTSFSSIEKTLSDNYSIDIIKTLQTFPKSEQSNIVDALFDHCYSYIANQEEDNTFVKQKYFFENSSSNSVYNYLYKQVKRHTILTTAYSLLDYSSDDYTYISGIGAKKRVTNLSSLFPTLILQKESTRNRYYFHDFLPDFTNSLIDILANPKISRKFLNQNKIQSAEVKRLNQMIREKIYSLLLYHQHLHNPCSKQMPKIQQFLYFQKLESLLGADTLIHTLQYITEGTLTIDDLIFFQSLPNVFDRFTLLSLYLKHELNMNELLYLKERLIPLVTNTFFVTFYKLLDAEAINVVSTYLDKSLQKPPELDNVQSLKARLTLQEMAKNDFDKFPISSDLLIYQKTLYQWYSTWSDAAYLLSNDYNSNIAPQATWIQATIDDFISHTTENEKRKFLEFLSNRYTSSSWSLPTSQLPVKYEITSSSTAGLFK